MRRLWAVLCLLTGLTATRGDAAQTQLTEGFVNAPVAEVWRLFTTSEGFKATGVALADVDLKLGGLIRSHSDPRARLGDPETSVSEILSFEPQRMLSLRLKAVPASFPHREAVEGTWTVIYFTKSGEDMTHVRIVNLGYRDDASSQALREYVEKGNRGTLDRIAKPYAPQCALCKKDAENAAAR